MKKIILLFAMMLAVVGVQAQSVHKLYAVPMSVGNGNISWNESTNTFTVSGAGNNTYQLFAFPAGTLSKYSKIHITISNTNDRVLFMYKDGDNEVNVSWSGFSSTGLKDKPLSEISGLSSVINQITSIRIGGPGSGGTVSGNITLNPDDTWLETESCEAMEITTTIDSSSDKDTPFSWSATGTLSSILNQLSDNTKATKFGYDNNNDAAHGCFNITGYDRIKLVLSSNDTGKNQYIRLMSSSGQAGDALSFNLQENAVTYEILRGSLSACSSVKAGAGASNSQNVNSIAFSKYFGTDETTEFSIAASSSSTVAYDRTFTSGQASTICLPFNLSSTEVTATGGKFYEFESATSTSLKFSEVSETTAYTPYLFVASTNTTPFSSLTDKEIVASEGANTTVTKNGFSFIGTLAKTPITSGDYGFNGGELKKAGTGVTIKAFRGYFTGAFSESRSIDIDLGDGSVTGISKIQAETSNDTPIYNLNGQRVGTDYKGIVIQNGKKVIKK